MCRHCGNAESATTSYLNRFRLEGTGKDSVLLRCLSCQTAVSAPMSQLSTLFYHYAC
jgi:RNase P subunit RPR2